MDAVTQCSRLKFQFEERLGYLTFCPKNFGLAIRVTATINLSNLNTAGKIPDLAKTHNVDIREMKGN